MKQVIQNYKSGAMSVRETPAPQLQSKGVLVQTAYSLISAGTERSMVEMARKSLLEKARSRPDLVRKVLDKARTEGFLSAYSKAMVRLSTDSTLGYSSAGIVLAVGSEAKGLRAGMRVACAGVGYANHAEMAYVPRNLCVPLPETIELKEAAFTTVAAIALQGVRAGAVALDEVVAVIGLGLVGLLTVQLLKANGCKVLGVDLDPAKCKMASEFGVDETSADATEQMAACMRLSEGRGADVVLITAATSSSEPLYVAGQLGRDRARIVVVGQIGMDVPRKLYYEKELSLVMSRSYGPGRYDRSYEEKGNDYPAGYVRWTENRNMEAVVSLIAQRKLSLKPFITHEYPIDKAIDAYEMILGGKEKYLGVLLAYPETDPAASRVVQLDHQKGVASIKTVSGAEVGIGMIGAGGFGTGTLLPSLAQQKGIALRGICSQRGLTARSVGDKWEFEFCTSDVRELLNTNSIDCVLICTRPDSHADLVCKALNAGKHVFVEKPLAVNLEQLIQIQEAVQNNPGRVLMVGFNRRFSPFVQEMKQFIQRRGKPLVATYRVNAGSLPHDDWQLDPEQGGGRIIGECGHFIDVLCYLTGSRPTEVFASTISDPADAGSDVENASLTIRFADGSLGTIIYTTQGTSGFSKERLEVFSDGSVAVIDDFRTLELVGKGTRKRQKSWLKQDKGHASELQTFVDSVRGGLLSVDPEDYFQTTLCTIQAVDSLRSGCPKKISLEMLEKSLETAREI
jgi:predicted dehydrogenase/threonine dehydrogenase-like Zn-dependent dehydrogenase